ncbi:uncharacterized protein LOC126740697 isoform X2 [Anthonomus grandis grandis]|nr:uncharacterized protein LOC126740697 isoform X2 [Anthonomus grandis grandis]XP_050302794.1 uncharacterized protein LOC126740697 isoform X2 [Anthonomus grandis grandis]XP_050302803.1 uncharacterized protein LOC126740697 isoform X2 [Anthonomus grandis grandis]XP_050302809.1 uncharacterized protein LOC126740697 isoform X2 [Anthonomus grandis grandis]
MDEPTQKPKCSLGILCGKTSLFVLTFGYALLGAILFKYLEGDGEKHQVTDFRRSREDCLKELWIITERLNVLYEKNWTALVTEQLKKFERSVVENAAKNDDFHNVSGQKWTFGESLLYTVTLLTTVGYGKLSPRTTLGKLTSLFYALVGVPLTLIFLSELGHFLAKAVRRGYIRMCLHKTPPSENFSRYTVEFQKAARSPIKNNLSIEDLSSMQIASVHNTPNHIRSSSTTNRYAEYPEVPKRAVLATVRANHTRGRCRSGPVHQVLTDPNCPAHRHNHENPLRNSSIVGISSDIGELDEVDENDQSECIQHDTPSRIPLIWKPPDQNGLLPSKETIAATVIEPSVPMVLVATVFFAYITLGAAGFATSTSWTFLDAIYFCFLAIATIGVGDRLPVNYQNNFESELYLLAYCLYIFVGLVVLAMCFNLLQEEVTIRCRQLASNLGFAK